MTVRPLEAGELDEVRGLIEAYPYKTYRHYRVLSRKAQTEVMLAEIGETLRHPDGVALRVTTGDGEALAVGRTLSWDSAFFGVPMARIEYVVAPRRELLPASLAAICGALTERGARHVSIRIDVADVEAVAAAETYGFRLMDALTTYTARPRETPSPLREVGAIRDLRPEDGPELVQIAAAAYKGFRGRFHFDPHLPDERCDALYVEWARQCVTGTMADTVLVSEGTDGRLLGFLAFRERQPVSRVGGVPVFGGGLGACRADAPGAYGGLIRAGTLWAHARGGVAECQTQNFNFPTIRIYEAVGLHYVRAEYTLHWWAEV